MAASNGTGTVSAALGGCPQDMNWPLLSVRVRGYNESVFPLLGGLETASGNCDTESVNTASRWAGQSLSIAANRQWRLNGAGPLLAVNHLEQTYLTPLNPTASDLRVLALMRRSAGWHDFQIARNGVFDGVCHGFNQDGGQELVAGAVSAPAAVEVVSGRVHIR